MKLLFLSVFLGFYVGFNNVISSEKEVVHSQDNRKKALEDRVESRWQSIKKNDLGSVYGFFTPAKRKLYGLKRFESGRGAAVGWQSAKIRSVEFVGNAALVTIDAKYRVLLPNRVALELDKSLGEISSTLRERWLWKDDVWWFVGESHAGVK